MATPNQLSGVAVQGGDIPCKNYGAADLAEGVCVKLDAANPGGAGLPRGVVLTTSHFGAYGFTTMVLYAGKVGMVRTLGQAIGISGSAVAIAEGTVLMSDAAGRMVPQTTGLTQIGVAASTTTTVGERIAVDIRSSNNNV